MERIFKDRTLLFWIGLGGGALGLITVIFYLIYSISALMFAPWVLIALILGVAASAFAVLTDFKFASIIPALFYALGLGIFIGDRVEMFAMMGSGVYGIMQENAILEVVVVLLVLMAITMICAIVSNFGKQREIQN